MSRSYDPVAQADLELEDFGTVMESDDELSDGWDDDIEVSPFPSPRFIFIWKFWCSGVFKNLTFRLCMVW